MVSALRLVIGEIVLHILRGIVSHHIGQTTGEFIRAVTVIHCALGVQLTAQFVACVDIVSGIEIAVSRDTAHVVHRGGNGSLDARVDGRRIDRHTTPTADAEDTYPLRIHVVTGRKVVHCRAEILGINIGRCHIARQSSTLARERGVEGYRKEAALSKFLRIQPGGLLLHGSERTADGYCRQLAAIRILGNVEVRGKCHAVAVVEGNLAVGHLVAQRECLVPFLSEVEFFFHKSCIFLCNN